MFQFHPLEHLLVQENPQNYQIELMPHLLRILNQLQYHELILEEAKLEIIRILSSNRILLHYYVQEFQFLTYL